jgi:hypothetical protein
MARAQTHRYGYIYTYMDIYNGVGQARAEVGQARRSAQGAAGAGAAEGEGRLEGGGGGD